MINFDGHNLRQRLCALPIPKQLAFMLLFCERMMPQRLAFARSTGFGIGIYRECLDRGWLFLVGRREPGGYESWAKICVDNSPDTEDFQHSLTSAALDATLSIADLMSFLSDSNIDHIIEAAGWARDTAFMYVEGTEHYDSTKVGLEQIDHYPMVQRELRRQLEDLKFVESLSEGINHEALTALRERSRRAPGILETEK